MADRSVGFRCGDRSVSATALLGEEFFEGDLASDVLVKGDEHPADPAPALLSLDRVAARVFDGDMLGVVKALARAHAWADLLEQGKVGSIGELARTLDVDASYVARIMKLTSLAPDIVNAILSGEEPPGLSLTKLTRSLPEEWGEQRRVCGISNQFNISN